jgi:pimeloyl-ACP methyl ester carboxylesterase
MSNPSTVVLVHGAWGGSWCWERVMPLLEARGVTAVAVELPSVDADAADPPGLADDVTAVVRALDTGRGSFVVCGHSYGGFPVTVAAAGRSDVRHLVYVCAFMPDVGESLFTLTSGPAPWIQLLEDGRTLPDLERVAAVGYADCDEQTRAAAVARLRPHVRAPFVEPVGGAAWREIPSTYIVCTEDRSLPVELQRDLFAPRAGFVVELASSHWPFLSQPERIADLLADRAGA